MIATECLHTLCAPFISGGNVLTRTAQDSSGFTTFFLNLLSTKALARILTYKAEFTATVTPDAAMPNIHEDVYISPMRWKKIMEIATLNTKQTNRSLRDAIRTVRLWWLLVIMMSPLSTTSFLPSTSN